MDEQVQSKSQLLYAAGVAIHGKDQQIKDLRARLAAVEAERDRLRRQIQVIAGGICQCWDDVECGACVAERFLATPAADAGEPEGGRDE